MPKMKTKSGVKKRFKVSGSGKVRARKAFTGHLMMNKPQSMKRKARGVSTLAKPDGEKILKNWMPYSRKSKNSKAQKNKISGGQ